MSPRLLVVSVLIILHSLLGNCEMAIDYSLKLNLSKCIQNIIERYFIGGALSYINLDDDDDDQLLNELHAMKVPVGVVKWPHISENINKGYFLYIRNESLFDHANYLIQEKYWDPYARFIIVVNQLELCNIRKIFDILLGLRVYNVVVVNETDTAELYSYNAFENNACGNFYSDIISYGKCFQDLTKLYQNKVKSLRNCFLRVTVPHTPPHSMDPALIKNEVYVPGIEQYLTHLLSKAEHFSYSFSYDINPEAISTISKNMSVTGPLMLLQNNKTDMFLGGRFLLKSRARKFSYINGYMDNEDNIATVVKRATVLPPWQDFYRGFSYGLWIMAFVSFIIYFSLLVLLFKPRDKCYVLMIMLDNVFQHGTLLKPDQPDKIFIIIWVWFAYVLNCCFQSTLVSLIQKPNTGYQVRTYKDIRLYGIKPCVSPAMLGYFTEFSGTPAKVSNNRCTTLMDSLIFVSQNDGVFTAVPHSLFLYNIQLLKDEYGQLPVYIFHTHHSNLMYALFLSKGFPLVDKLTTWTLRFKEAGLIKKHYGDILFWRQIKYNKYRFKEFESRVAVPWLIYATGVFLSLVAFLFETVLLKYCIRCSG